MVKDLRPANEIYPLYEKFKPFVEEVFIYLNGYVNPYNPCQLYIAMFSTHNYAEFAKPNLVISYLGSIVNNFHDNEDTIKKVIIITLTHELFHSEQSLDMLRYGKDPYYQMMAELQNEGYAEKWVMDHAGELYSKFGVIMLFEDTERLKHADFWEQNTVKNHYLRTIVDVVYRNEGAFPIYSDLFDAHDTISFHINDSMKVLIKYRGEYNDRGMPLFNQIINKYCRRELYITYFNIKSKITKDEQIFGQKGIDIHFELSNNYMKPIEF